ncbi:MAG: hypothetical protein P1U77_28255, partial [Rubripirellula sp.]|nr:hypothetical protein [Rubripirellula sp.]
MLGFRSESLHQAHGVGIPIALPESDIANLCGLKRVRACERSRRSSKFGGSQRLVIKSGDRPRESHSIIHRHKSLPQSTLRRTFLNRDKTTVE